MRRMVSPWYEHYGELLEDVGGVCRVCGCTDALACQTDEGPCHWVEKDLCSACVGKETQAAEDRVDACALALHRPELEDVKCPQCGDGDYEDIVPCRYCDKVFCNRCGSVPEGICDACAKELAEKDHGDPDSEKGEDGNGRTRERSAASAATDEAAGVDRSLSE